ncbi:LysR family transcriptional regulator ArgP [Phytobacter sp. V91]|uniref:LysR family transcriptional regulator ArgP n=1 Tax=Phytobacter sp. V91 TaxID=3369425 RepID=UPI003F60EA01
MKLNYSFLETFVEIIRSGSFEMASRRLHITPSAVSQRIRVLEEAIGQILIIRGSPCRATQSGTELYRYAEKVELLESDFFAVQEKKHQGKAVVAVNADSVDGWFLTAINKAFREHDIVVDVRIEDQDYSAALLQTGEVMAAVSADPTLLQGCKVDYLGTMQYKAWASVGYYNEYFTAGVSEETLKHAPVIMFNHKDDLQNKFLRHFTASDIAPPVQFIPSTSAYLHAVARGLGWGMLPEHLSAPLCAQGVLVEIAEGYSVDTPLYWHRWSLKLALLEQLSECVQFAARKELRA